MRIKFTYLTTLDGTTCREDDLIEHAHKVVPTITHFYCMANWIDTFISMVALDRRVSLFTWRYSWHVHS